MSQPCRYSPPVARSPAQRGKVGNWLVESRMARGWDTQSEAREQIARLANWKIPQSVYAEWESGRRLPSEANLDRLRSFYGDAPGTTETPDALVTALMAQAAAIRALAETIAQERAERIEWERGVVSSIREVALALAQRDARGRELPEGAQR